MSTAKLIFECKVFCSCVELGASALQLLPTPSTAPGPGLLLGFGLCCGVVGAEPPPLHNGAERGEEPAPLQPRQCPVGRKLKAVLFVRPAWVLEEHLIKVSCSEW